MRIYTFNGWCNISGDKIRTCRINEGMSQDQFAARLQVEGLRLGQKQISRIENRERVLADFELKIIARVLGLSTDDLLSEESTDKGWYL